MCNYPSCGLIYRLKHKTTNFNNIVSNARINFLWSAEHYTTVAYNEWIRVENIEGRGGKGEEPKGGKIPIEKEDILDERLLRLETRTTAGDTLVDMKYFICVFNSFIVIHTV